MLTDNANLAKYTSFRTGGSATQLFIPNNLSELIDFIKNNSKKLMLLGLGSNLLIRDGGYDGVVIKLSSINDLSLSKNTIIVDAGTTLAKLARFAQDNNIYGAEFLSAIPGTIGGALAMNAGAFGSEIWEFVHSVKTIDTNGVIHNRHPGDFDISYRSVKSNHKDEFFLSCKLIFQKKNKNHDIKQLLEKRNQSQPIGLPSCGSVFKKPKDNFAAKLIEDSGLKGFCIGGACVSDKHANFIINKDNATAENIENLINHIQQVVKSKFDIELEQELVIRGNYK